MNRTIKRLAIPLAGAAVVGSSGFAFMASNTLTGDNYAGNGRAAISGYTVSGVHYNYVDNAGNPNLDYIKSVTFTLDHKASRASAQINNNQTWVPYTACSSADAYTWTCANSTGAAASLNYPGGSPSAADLSVSAAS